MIGKVYPIEIEPPAIAICILQWSEKITVSSGEYNQKFCKVFKGINEIKDYIDAFTDMNSSQISDCDLLSALRNWLIDNEASDVELYPIKTAPRGAIALKPSLNVVVLPTLAKLINLYGKEYILELIDAL